MGMLPPWWWRWNGVPPPAAVTLRHHRHNVSWTECTLTCGQIHYFMEKSKWRLLKVLSRNPPPLPFLFLYDSPLLYWDRPLLLYLQKVETKSQERQEELNLSSPHIPALAPSLSIYLPLCLLGGGGGSHIVSMPSAWHSQTLCRLCPPQVRMSLELPSTMTGSMWLEGTPFGPTSLWHAFRWEMWLLDLVAEQLWHVRATMWRDVSSSVLLRARCSRMEEKHQHSLILQYLLNVIDWFSW